MKFMCIGFSNLQHFLIDWLLTPPAQLHHTVVEYQEMYPTGSCFFNIFFNRSQSWLSFEKNIYTCHCSLRINAHVFIQCIYTININFWIFPMSNNEIVKISSLICQHFIFLFVFKVYIYFRKRLFFLLSICFCPMPNIFSFTLTISSGFFYVLII